MRTWNLPTDVAPRPLEGQSQREKIALVMTMLPLLRRDGTVSDRDRRVHEMAKFLPCLTSSTEGAGCEAGVAA